MKIRQLTLRLEKTNRYMVAWVDDDPRLKVGRVIEGKKDKQRWVIEQMYGAVEKLDINRDWHVGGL